MPLKEGFGQETITDNIQELMDSPTFAPGKPRRKRWEMARAAAARKAGKRDDLSRETMNRRRSP